MPDQEQRDPTARIPGLRALSERTRQLILLILALMVMIGMGLLLFLDSTPSASGTNATGSPSPTDTPGVEISGDAAPPDAPEASEASDAATTPDTGSTAAGDASPSDGAADRERHQGPATEATGGPLEPSEQKRVTALIDTVVPVWSEADFSGRPDSGVDDRAAKELTRKWVAGWRDEGRVTADFTDASSRRFNELWGGAIQMQATVSDATVTRAQLIDNYGAESYWKVDVQRTVTAPGVEQQEQITWYFMITNRAEGPLLDEFFLPSDIAADDPEGGHDHG